MMKTIGFLGCGNMGGAIARAVCKATEPENVFLANRTAAKAEAAAAFGNDFHRYFLPSISFRRVSTAARSCWSARVRAAFACRSCRKAQRHVC